MKARPEALALRDSIRRNYEQVDSFAHARNTNYVFNRSGNDRLEVTELNGNFPRALRRLSLVKTRHSVAHLISGEDNEMEQKFIEIADEIRINKIFKKTFENDDPFANYNSKEIIELMGSPEQIKSNVMPLVLEFARTINSSANSKLLRRIEQPKLKNDLKIMKSLLTKEMTNIKHCLCEVNDDRHQFERHERVVIAMANIIRGFSDPKKNPLKSAIGQPQDKDLKPQNWCKLKPAYPKLEIVHNGRMNRKRRANELGKTPKYLNRLLTDPSRRIFAKKAKSLGGVVVIDCSGSMSLSNDQIEKLVTSASGSSIWTYSATCRDYELENCWLIADRGKRVRELPNFHGGNGVDLPALAFARRYRKNKNDIMIWISDGRVTGNGDTSDTRLRRATAHFIRKNNIHHVEEINEAIKLLSDAQKGKHNRRKVSYWERQQLSK